jgi:hypothetical protein
MIQRRGFLKILGSIAATAALGKVELFREVNAKPFQRSDWIDDHGDYLHIRIPPGKVLENMELPKPCLIEFGEYSTLRKCNVIGFANLYGKYATVETCHFDGRHMRMDEDRAVMSLYGDLFHVLNSRIDSNGDAPCVLIPIAPTISADRIVNV